MKKEINDLELEEVIGKRLWWQSNRAVEWSCKTLVERVISTSEKPGQEESTHATRSVRRLPYRHCNCFFMRVVSFLYLSSGDSF